MRGGYDDQLIEIFERVLLESQEIRVAARADVLVRIPPPPPTKANPSRFTFDYFLLITISAFLG